MKKITNRNDFVQAAKKIHGDKYDYSEFEYVRSIDKSKIKCNTCGLVFEQSANTHLAGHGCPYCSKHKGGPRIHKLTYEEFVKRSKEKHGDKYEYSPKGFEKSSSIVNIFCKKHQHWFKQKASYHMIGQGCPECAKDMKHDKMAHTQEEFIELATKKHNGKYLYDRVVYKTNKEPVEIGCPVHGYFWQRPDEHLKGRGCQKCVGRGKTKEDFIKEAVAVHGDRYDYSKVVYTKSEDKVEIICKTCGKTFWQKPWVHLQNHGCPYCNFSKMENAVMDLLSENGIQFIPQHTFDWLIYKSNLYLDFYLPEYNIAIECQGAQHFPDSNGFGYGDKYYKLLRTRDEVKYKLCREHNIDIIYFTDIETEIDGIYIGQLFRDYDSLLKEIKGRLKQNLLQENGKETFEGDIRPEGEGDSR